MSSRDALPHSRQTCAQAGNRHADEDIAFGVLALAGFEEALEDARRGTAPHGRAAALG